jgi:hypothetical protein
MDLPVELIGLLKHAGADQDSDNIISFIFKEYYNDKI